ncbi:MAG: hypothetical protein KF805_12070 [Phycisphaeraceae bacterium]|nr:hypothetical protein [Phycisphaeraceae bacterium]
MNQYMIAFVVGAAATSSIVRAQGTLTASYQVSQANAHYVLPGGASPGNFGQTNTLPGTGNDFTATENRLFNNNGFSGRGFAVVAATFNPSSPGLGGPFMGATLDACTSAEVFASSIGPHSREESYGRAYGEISFSLSQGMGWTWTGVSQGTSYNTGSYHAVTAAFTLTDINTGFSYVNILDTTVNGVGNFFNPFALGGFLPAGDYRLTWLHESICTGGNTQFGFYPTAFGGAPLISCIPSTFSLVPTPSTAAAFALAGLLATRRRRN